MKILSLFANIGVAEAYLERLGFDVVVANEFDSKRAKLYQEIYPSTHMICGDIRQPEVINQIISEGKEIGIDILMATPPCQGMSTAGKQDKFDKRNNLFLYAIDVIKEVKPKYFFFENVPAFISTYIIYNSKEHLIPDVIQNELGDLYDISYQIINTKDYEVPQMRERVIFLATRKDVRKKWVMPLKSDTVVTMEDAIGWIPTIDPFVKDLKYDEFIKLFPHYEERKKKALSISKWNYPPSHVYRNVLAMQYTPTGCTAFDNEFYKPLKKDGTLVKGFKNTYKRQNWNTPAYTIAMDNIQISSQNNVHPGRFIKQDEYGNKIYSDPRALTLFELMLLMSIPSDWPLPTNSNPNFVRKVLGEGIPSLLIKKIFSELI